MKTSYTTLDTYNVKTYSHISGLALFLGLCSGVIFTVLKICGLFPSISVSGVVAFDILCCGYLVIGYFIRRAQFQKEEKINTRLIQKLKILLLILVLLQWNMISYMFPTRDFWGFAPLYAVLLVFFFDSALILYANIGLAISIALSWLIKGDELLPIRDEMFAVNLIFRIVALLVFFVVIIILTKLTEEAHGRISETTEKKLFEGTSVLMVDDNTLTRELNSEILEEEGAEVTQAESGQKAIEIIRKKGYFDVILMDIVMPGMDGIEATRRIRALEKNSEYPMAIIALTGEATDDQVYKILSAGAVDCLNKPLVVTELSRILISVMKKRSMAIGKKLEDTIRIANTDPLTKVKNITAYTDKVTELSEKMRDDSQFQFAIVMCDINGLKDINDTQGHDVGDTYIMNCSQMICDTYKHSPVYRIGGDEFVAVLQGKSYTDRDKLLEQMNADIEVARKKESVRNGMASIAVGMAVYDPDKDYQIGDVIKRADEAMYTRKRQMKDLMNGGMR